MTCVSITPPYLPHLKKLQNRFYVKYHELKRMDHKNEIEGKH